MNNLLTWKTAFLTLLITLLSLGALLYYYYSNDTLKVEFKKVADNVQEQSNSDKAYIFDDFVAPEDIQTGEETSPIVVPEVDTPKTETKVTSNEDWYTKLDSNTVITNTTAFNSFWTNAVKYMEGIKDYSMDSEAIITGKGNITYAIQKQVTVLDKTTERVDLACPIKLTSDGYDCLEARKTYTTKEVQDDTNLNLYTIYTKVDNEEWETSTTEISETNNYTLMSTQYNPKNMLGIDDPDRKTVVVGAYNKTLQPYGKGIDIVYLKSTVLSNNDVYYYLVNLSAGEIYRIVEYGPSNSSAEYRYDVK